MAAKAMARAARNTALRCAQRICCCFFSRCALRIKRIWHQYRRLSGAQHRASLRASLRKALGSGSA
jgi:hypothetical protein